MRFNKLIENCLEIGALVFEAATNLMLILWTVNALQCFFILLKKMNNKHRAEAYFKFPSGYSSSYPFHLTKNTLFSLRVLIFLVFLTSKISSYTSVSLLLVTCLWSCFGFWSRFELSLFTIEISFCWLCPLSPISYIHFFLCTHR